VQLAFRQAFTCIGCGSVSLAYKESANCRLECNYGMQNDCDMIPLMMQADFRAKGWLGLILGTRLWYGFFDSDLDGDAAFETRVDAVCNEIGSRGKPKLPEEAVPPAPAPAPVPTAPTRAPAPAPAPAAVPVAAAVAPAQAPPTLLPPATPGGGAPLHHTITTPTVAHDRQSPDLTSHGQTLATCDHVWSPEMESSHRSSSFAPAPGPATGGGGGTSLTELSGFLDIMHEQADRAEAKMGALRKEAEAKLEAQRKEAEAKLEAVRTEVEDQKKDIEKLRAELAALQAYAISEAQLAALQSRLQALHEAELLTDEEMHGLEDSIVDGIEVTPTAGASSHELDKVMKMVLLSSKVHSDATLARQLRRKIVS
jgi:hypothetical protein